ncbi:hypothetical protein [Olivibacter jilunii]|uniref:hypothetical protein n=1 Tax=Olivibacter jilunii TaxID=985016 RepID=UPI0010301E32|nr:hypothetical protein [Olivibacter jilunii]
MGTKKSNIYFPNFQKKDNHHWADYLELLCVFNIDKMLSQNDFIDRLSNRRDREDTDDFKKHRAAIEINQNNSILAEDVYSLIAYRVEVFKGYYPFYLSDDNKVIYFKEDISDRSKIYILMLFCSCLGAFSKYNSIFTSSFEQLSLLVLKAVLPAGAEVHLFGSSNIESVGEESKKNELFWEKLTTLAEHLREQVLIKREDLSEKNRGDGGLDIYGLSRLGDKNKHFPIYFCQCACTPEWVNKQHSSKFDSWNEFITLSTYPLNVVFIPYSFRRANGNWHEEYKIKKSVVFDRQRMLHHLHEEIELKKFDSFDIIAEILATKESVV